MAASSVLSLFFQLWSGMRDTIVGVEKPRIILRTSLRILPWILFVAMSLGCLIDGLQHPSEVLRSRDFFYCSASWRIGHAGSFVSGACILASVILEMHVVYMLIYVWRAPTSRRELLPVDSIVRMWLFSIYGASCVIIAIIVVQFPTGLSPRYPFLFLSTLPLAVWLIFWTQKDVLRIWTSCCCRRTITGLESHVIATQQHTSGLKSLALTETAIVN
ncbi:hypothetical protein AURDEDRAFT_145111 [Auricularia subglabra TFB-10046 SS5]|nr:hypothetical protein AURDEDRAFT_145111 [Auricularia subglabra TFB-10046 SS5]